jgi:hypothetical protein
LVSEHGGFSRIFIEKLLLGDFLPTDRREEIYNLWLQALDVGIKCRAAVSCKSFSNANALPALDAVDAR